MRQRRLIGLTLLFGLVVPLGSSKAAVPAGGFVKSHGTLCQKSGSVSLYLEFRGRMPAGAKTYTVTTGTGGGWVACDYNTSLPPVTVALHGETPSGPFDWTCTGQIRYLMAMRVDDALPPEVRQVVETDRWVALLQYDAHCTTIGLPGTFAFQAYPVLSGAGLSPWEDDFARFSSNQGLYHAAVTK